MKEKCGTGDVVYWRCERKYEFGCKGRLKTNDTTIAAITGMHSHAPERKKKYQQCDERLRALLHSIEQRSPREFLRGVRHNLAFNVVA